LDFGTAKRNNVNAADYSFSDKPTKLKNDFNNPLKQINFRELIAYLREQSAEFRLLGELLATPCEK